MSNDKGLQEEIARLNRVINGGHFGMPVNLNIKAFKRYILETFPQLSKHDRNYLTVQYKKEAWGDYDKVVKYKLSEPTRKVSKKENDGK